MNKIAVLLDNYLNLSETFIYEKLKGFKSFDPMVLSYRVGNLNIYPFDRIYSLHSESSFLGQLKRTMFVNFGFSPFFQKTLKDNNVKLLQVHYAIRAIEARRLSSKLKMPQVNFFHGSDLDMFLNKKNNLKYLIRLIASTSASIVVSMKMKNDLLRVNCDPNKIHLIYEGIDLDKYPLKTENINNSNINLLMCGRLMWKKGFELGIEALSILSRSHKNIEMRIIGDGELKASLSSLIDKFGLTNKIKMVGALPPSLIAQEMAKSDIFLVPSLFEGLPTVIKEAMAVGLPVIASNIGGIPEIITDGYNGFLVESKNAIALADKIEYVLNNSDNLNIIRINARKTIEYKFNTKKQMKFIEDLYSSLIKENMND